MAINSPDGQEEDEGALDAHLKAVAVNLLYMALRHYEYTDQFQLIVEDEVVICEYSSEQTDFTIYAQFRNISDGSVFVPDKQNLILMQDTLGRFGFEDIDVEIKNEKLSFSMSKKNLLTILPCFNFTPN